MTRAEGGSTEEAGEAATLRDASMDAAMGRLLQAGVLLASTVVLAGGVLYLRTAGGGVPNYRRFASEPGALRSMHGLMRLIGQGDPAAIIQMGVLLLIATPVARVVFAAGAFALQRDRMYVGISVAILAILLTALFLLR